MKTKLKASYILVPAGILLFIFSFLFTFRPVGKSMEPTLHEGDLCFTTPVYDGNLTGKIVVYQPVPESYIWHAANGMSVCHRVIVDNGTHVVCQGDNNQNPDPPIPKSNVSSVLLFSIPSPFCYSFFILESAMVVTPLIYPRMREEFEKET